MRPRRCVTLDIAEEFIHRHRHRAYHHQACKSQSQALLRTGRLHEVANAWIPCGHLGQHSADKRQSDGDFAIDLPLWLFEQIKAEADENYSTVRGQILKLLLARYKN